MNILLLLALAQPDDARLALEVAPDEVSVLTEAQRRALMCRGPVSVIADDDPGLILYADRLAESGLEEAKIELAMDRGEACEAATRNVLAGASVSTIAAAVEHFCQEETRDCRMLRTATKPNRD